MIGIYNDSFLDFLRKNLGDPIKITSGNIICRCPWCEYNLVKKHYHCYISLKSPIFNCFFAECGAHGTVSKLVKKIRGTSLYKNEFFDSEKIKYDHKQSVKFDYGIDNKKPSFIVKNDEATLSKYAYKLRYIMSRLQWAELSYHNLNGLVLDVSNFLIENKIKITSQVSQLLLYLDQNFVGFLSEHNRVLILRNVNPFSSFRYLKIPLVEDNTQFIDYYIIRNAKFVDNDIPVVVIAEGIFDILAEFYNDTTSQRRRADIYVSSLGLGSYASLMKSLAFYEGIYKCHLVILSDRGVSLNYYKKLKKYYSSLVSTIEIYFNKSGKDFACFPCFPEKFAI